MLIARKIYPLGIQTFERIRKEDKLYIDKTEYIYHMTHTSGNMTTIMPLLYQSGYITIKDYNQEYNYYTLDIPNKEVNLVDVEVHTPKGRVDIVLLTKTNLYLIELKLNQDAQTAMQQINLKNYRQRFALSEKPITKVGVNFDGTTRNITDWVIE